jgi:hypothetical protein
MYTTQASAIGTIGVPRGKGNPGGIPGGILPAGWRVAMVSLRFHGVVAVIIR